MSLSDIFVYAAKKGLTLAIDGNEEKELALMQGPSHAPLTGKQHFLVGPATPGLTLGGEILESYRMELIDRPENPGSVSVMSVTLDGGSEPGLRSPYCLHLCDTKESFDAHLDSYFGGPSEVMDSPCPFTTLEAGEIFAQMKAALPRDFERLKKKDIFPTRRRS